MIYLAIIFIGIIGIFYYNTLIWLIESWLNNPYYSHGFIVPIVSIFIIWKIRKELFEIKKKESQMGIIFFISGIILQSVAILSNIRFLSGISLIVTIFGTILYLFGWKFTNRIKFPILFLLLMIPIPFIDLVAPPIQTISAATSASLTNLLGVPVQREGLLLNTGAGTFEVAFECSGLKSIISLLTIAIIYAFILEGKLIMKSVIVLSSIPLALTGNILRIISILMVSDRYGQDTTLNYFHDFSDILFFSIVFIGLLLVGRCFGRLRFKKTF